MNAEWRFYTQSPTDPIHNPISAEFFSTEAVGNVAEALIREGIQNTLDARIKKADGSRQPARVRIFVSDTAGALPPRQSRKWFDSLWPHVMAQGNGLRNQPGKDEPCPFLVYEDFGTVGLTGNVQEHLVVEHKTNHFLNFFRAEGHSDKGEKDRGSWGVGKTVFPRASRIGSFFGFTVRSDDNKQLLLGRSILKYHRIGGQSCKSDGYFGVRRDDDFMLPCGDPAILAEFRSDFQISRQSETGLSIVVPWYDLDGDDGLSRDKIVAAVLRGFFYPILMGFLAVTVVSPDDEIMLDNSSIMGSLESVGGKLAAELLPRLELAEWAQTRIAGEFHTLIAPSSEEAQNWSAELVPPDVVEYIRDSLARRQRVALRVPMFVRPRNASPTPTFFNVFLEHSEEDGERPVFIRDELIISDVKCPRVSQVRSLVIVEDRSLSTLLRDAETPAHTQWNQDTSNFKNKYTFGPGAIKFVQFSITRLLQIINQAEQKPDPSITVDFFSIPASPEDDDAVPAQRRRPAPKDGAGPAEFPRFPVQPRFRRFRIDRMRGGFSIKPGDADAPLPPYIDIQVAYDVRRGNPLTKYHFADFDLSKAPIHCDRHNGALEINFSDTNRMLVAVREREFQLDVTGFDTNRELYVRAETRDEVADD
jgi:hypothetical protein